MGRQQPGGWRRCAARCPGSSSRWTHAATFRRILHDETGCRPTSLDCLGIQSPQVRACPLQAAPARRIRSAIWGPDFGGLPRVLRSEVAFSPLARSFQDHLLRAAPCSEEAPAASSRAQVGRKRGWIDRREYCALFGFAGKSQKSVNRRLINLPESIVRPLARLPDAGYNDGCVPLISQRAHSFPVPR
jgi:hypothetical protein